MKSALKTQLPMCPSNEADPRYNALQCHAPEIWFSRWSPAARLMLRRRSYPRSVGAPELCGCSESMVFHLGSARTSPSIRAEAHTPGAEAIVIGAKHAKILFGRLAASGKWLNVVELEVAGLSALTLREWIDVGASRLIAVNQLSTHGLGDIAGTDRGSGIGGLGSNGVSCSSGRS